MPVYFKSTTIFKPDTEFPIHFSVSPSLIRSTGEKASFLNCAAQIGLRTHFLFDTGTFSLLPSYQKSAFLNFFLFLIAD
ncbi:hypothetical protein AYI70_g1720 [Smittium culicis]|uniref:Uncharacterized protein n=1 Tax=Smittium culicis TaxID=133412 RepID=A0A1R1YC56_9FUNG|nr:hypothetical protein AYI70_g1720 [Smittium culicis]